MLRFCSKIMFWFSFWFKLNDFKKCSCLEWIKIGLNCKWNLACRYIINYLCFIEKAEWYMVLKRVDSSCLVNLILESNYMVCVRLIWCLKDVWLVACQVKWLHVDFLAWYHLFWFEFYS